MGLAIEVGLLADALANDPEDVDVFEEELAVVNRVLAAQRLPRHVEPRTLPEEARSRAGITGFPYSTLHYLRRAYAHRKADPAWRLTPLPEGEDPAADPLVESFDSHLLAHGDAEGWYVPIDFAEVVTSDEDDDLPGGLLGSSQRLLEELRFVAPALGIALADGVLPDAEAARVNDVVLRNDPLWAEHAAWIALFEAARISVQYKTAIVFC